jgi:UDP-glucuronate 4-epimerase
MKNRLLITGAAGFIGSNLSDSMLYCGHEIMGIDNFDPFYNRTVKEGNISAALTNPNFRFREGDILDSSFLDKCLSEFRPEIVIHLAAKAGVGPSLLNPHEYYQVNVMGTLNLLEAMRRNDIKNLVFASSSSVYGNNQKIPFSETDTVDSPISPYAASKKAGELLCHTFHHLYQFNIICLRFFTVYGPRQRPDLAIHKFVRAILNDEAISIFGDGSNSRDYTYIDDITDGINMAVLNCSGFEIVNLGGSQPVALLQLVSLIEQSTHKKAKINFLPMQKGDVNRTSADISKAEMILNFSPKVNIETGISKYIESLGKTPRITNNKTAFAGSVPVK